MLLWIRFEHHHNHERSYHSPGFLLSKNATLLVFLILRHTVGNFWRLVLAAWYLENANYYTPEVAEKRGRIDCTGEREDDAPKGLPVRGRADGCAAQNPGHCVSQFGVAFGAALVGSVSDAFIDSVYKGSKAPIHDLRPL